MEIMAIWVKVEKQNSHVSILHKKALGNPIRDCLEDFPNADHGIAKRTTPPRCTGIAFETVAAIGLAGGMMGVRSCCAAWLRSREEPGNSVALVDVAGRQR